jgi:hypothetical protein
MKNDSLKLKVVERTKVQTWCFVLLCVARRFLAKDRAKQKYRLRQNLFGKNANTIEFCARVEFSKPFNDAFCILYNQALNRAYLFEQA